MLESEKRRIDGQAEAGFPGVFGVALGQFDALLEELGAGCGVPADARSLVALRARVDRLMSLVAEAECRFDAAELWRDAGAGSIRGWLADACGLPAKEAAHAARRVRRLRDWPEVADAWRTGVLSGSQVDVVVAAVPNRFVEVFAEQAASVVRVLSPLDAAGTRFAMRRWVRCAEAADGPEHLRERRSGVHLDALLDGRGALTGDLCPADAAVLAATLRVFDVPDVVDERGEPMGEVRTLSQRNADALVAACRFALAHRDGAGQSGRFVPHVSLVIDVAELRAAAAHDHRAVGCTADGTELDATALGLLSCDSIVQRVMKAGDVVLSMGREVRTATPSQRRAIIARDHHCRAPGCRTGPKFCDVHHVDHWINGGRTDVHRMVLLCGTHHREFHRPGYRMELDDQSRFTVHSPNGWSRSTTPEHHDSRIFERPAAGVI